MPLQIENDALLHRHPRRAEIYAAEPGIFWSEQARRWFVTSGRLVREIQADPAFHVHTYDTSRLAERLGIDLSYMIRLSRYLPLAAEGEDHARLRREFSAIIGANQAAACDVFTDELRQRLERALAAGHFCMIKDVLAPALRRSNMRVAGFDLPDADEMPDIEVIPRLFDDRLSPTVRGRIETAIRTLHAFLPDEMDDEAKFTIIAFTALSSNTLIASLALSLLKGLQASAGKQLSEISWDEELPATSLPSIEKICTSPREIGGFSIAVGDRVRLFIESEAFETSSQPVYSDLYFAAGPHRCPGMAYSRRVWKALREELVRHQRRFEIGSVSYRPGDYIFTYPDTVEITVDDPSGH
jgi:cytochrome P450